MPDITCPHCKGSGKIDGTFGNKLRALRIGRGLTLRQLEAEVGISNAFLSQIERGIRSGMSVWNAKKLADFYGVTVDELVSEDEGHA